MKNSAPSRAKEFNNYECFAKFEDMLTWFTPSTDNLNRNFDLVKPLHVIQLHRVFCRMYRYVNSNIAAFVTPTISF